MSKAHDIRVVGDIQAQAVAHVIAHIPEIAEHDARISELTRRSLGATELVSDPCAFDRSYTFETYYHALIESAG